MIDREHDLPIVRQVEALNISRGSVYYLPRPVPDANLTIMRRKARSFDHLVGAQEYRGWQFDADCFCSL
jgi:hypothetical protein